jgi:hypothetical protein
MRDLFRRTLQKGLLVGGLVGFVGCGAIDGGGNVNCENDNENSNLEGFIKCKSHVSEVRRMWTLLRNGWALSHRCLS